MTAGSAGALSPNITAPPVAGTYAIPRLRRAAGGSTRICSSHVAPFHRHVSPRYVVAVAPLPPNATTPPIAGWSLMAWKRRAGGEVSGVWGTQVDPLHVQVSPSGAENDDVPPPNRTISPAVVSCAIACPRRADGDAAGVSCVQVVPSQLQVSPLTSWLAPTAPPNSSTRSLIGS